MNISKCWCELHMTANFSDNIIHKQYSYIIFSALNKTFITGKSQTLAENEPLL